MNQLAKFLRIALISLIGLFLVKLIPYFTPNDITPPRAEDLIKKLPKNVKKRIIVDRDGVTTVTPDKAKRQYVPPEGAVIIDQPKDGGDVVVIIKDKGLCLSPGIGIGVSEKLHPVLDVKLAYYKRVGFLAGVPLDSKLIFYPYLAIDVHPLARYKFSLFGGINTKKSIVLGLRVSF